MKKKNNFFIFFIIVFIVIILALVLSKFFDKSNLTELSVSDVIEKINNKESFVLCISQTTCSHCASYKPKLEKISRKYDIELFYIDIDNYRDDEVATFKKYISFDGGTPVTAFIKDGVEPTASNRIFGDSDYDKIVKKLKNNGFINE